jgi:hypothetical protein
LREAVDQRAPETEFLDAAFKFARGHFGILHRQRRQTDETIAPLVDFLRQDIVCFARDLRSQFRFVDGLHGRRIQRDDHDLDSGLVHEPESLVLKIKQPVAQFGPNGCSKRLRIAEWLRSRNDLRA